MDETILKYHLQAKTKDAETVVWDIKGQEGNSHGDEKSKCLVNKSLRWAYRDNGTH